MKFSPTEIPDVIAIEPEVFKDDRGFFFENYNQEIFSLNGISTLFVQDNHSSSSRGTLRGLHYQAAPKAQAKLVRVTRGEVFDVAVDIRKNSKTFGRCVTTIISEENKRMLYIPAGFAHGFLSLCDQTEVHYKVSGLYSPQHERGLVWNDPAVAIPWPKLDTGLILSEKDKKYPYLDKVME